MKLFLALDNENGVCFNGRRQSSDRTVLDEILKMLHRNSKATLWIDIYTASLPWQEQPHYKSVENIMCSAQPGKHTEETDWVFAETDSVSVLETCKDKITEIIVFRWNRTYPSDQKIELNESEWTSKVVKEFKGHSHEKITVERYKRRAAA